MESLYPEIERLIAENSLEEALRQIAVARTGADSVRAAELSFLRGKIYFRLGRRAAAISAYSEAAAAQPGDNRYATALAMLRRIEEFFNPDLLNP